MANYFGKRPIFVFASLLLSVCFLWGAVATSFESLFWSNVIAAFAGSSTEAVGVAIVNVSIPKSVYLPDIGFKTPKIVPVSRS